MGGPGHSGQPATQPPTPTATETDEQIQRAGDMVEGRRPEQRQIQRAGGMVEGRRPEQRKKDTRKRQRVDTRSPTGSGPEALVSELLVAAVAAR